MTQQIAITIPARAPTTITLNGATRGPAGASVSSDSLGLLTELQATPPSIPTDTREVTTSGSDAVGVGYARMKRVPALPTHPVQFRAQDLDYFEHADHIFRVEQIGELSADIDRNADIINDFYAYCFANRVDLAWHGFSATVGQPILMGGGALPSGTRGKTLTFLGSPELYAGASMNTLLEIRNTDYLRLVGKPRLFGNIVSIGVSTYTNRLAREGLRLNQAERLTMDGAYIQGFAFAGLVATGPYKTSISSLGDVSAVSNGSGKTGSAGLSSAFTRGADVGPANSFNQRTTLNVTTPPPAYMVLGDPDHPFKLSGGIRAAIADASGAIETYHVDSIDLGAGTISIFPKLDFTVTAGTLYYIFGAGVWLSGGDTSCVNFSQLDTRQNGVGCWAGSLYGPQIACFSAQGNSIGYIGGAAPVSASLGHDIRSYYFELTDLTTQYIDLGFYGSAITSNYGEVNNGKGLNTTKIRSFNATRGDASALFPEGQLTGGELPRHEIAVLGKKHKYARRAYNADDNTSSAIIDFNEPQQGPIPIQANFKTVTLAAITNSLNRLFGYDGGQILVSGTGANDSATGTWTFQAATGSRAAAVSLGSAIVTGIDTRGLLPGMAITGTNILAATTILTVDSTTQLTMSAPAVGVGTAVTVPTATINGGATFTMAGWGGPTLVSLRYNLSTRNWSVRRTSFFQPMGSKSFNFPSIPANSFGASTTVAVAGALVGDAAVASLDIYNAGLLLHAVVSAADTVTVTPQNITGAAIDPATDTLRVRLIK